MLKIRSNFNKIFKILYILCECWDRNYLTIPGNLAIKLKWAFSERWQIERAQNLPLLPRKPLK